MNVHLRDGDLHLISHGAGGHAPRQLPLKGKPNRKRTLTARTYISETVTSTSSALRAPSPQGEGNSTSSVTASRGIGRDSFDPQGPRPQGEAKQRPALYRLHCATQRRQAPPHPSSGLRGTPDATFPSRGRRFHLIRPSGSVDPQGPRPRGRGKGRVLPYVNQYSVVIPAD